MSVNFLKLFQLMKEKNITKYQLRKIISPSIVDKLLKGGHVDTRTIEKICEFLHCQPGDIMEYIPDSSDSSSANDKNKQ